jgi:hypothetical protein
MLTPQELNTAHNWAIRQVAPAQAGDHCHDWQDLPPGWKTLYGFMAQYLNSIIESRLPKQLPAPLHNGNPLAFIFEE